MNFDIIGAGPSLKEFQERNAEFYRQNGKEAEADAIMNDPHLNSITNNASTKAQIEQKGKFSSWFDNALTGDRDFQRQVALQQMQQDFNSAEAAKAFQRQLTIAQNSTKWQAEQLKQLGVNPAWAIAGGGGSNPSIATAPTATSQAGNASSSGSQFGGALNTFAQLVITAARLAVQANSPTVKGVFIPKK